MKKKIIILFASIQSVYEFISVFEVFIFAVIICVAVKLFLLLLVVRPGRFGKSFAQNRFKNVDCSTNAKYALLSAQWQINN